MPATIVWLREDLRVSDHPALAAAVETGNPLVLLYVFDPDASWAPGAASRWWLHHSLAALNQSISKLGGELVIRRGDGLKRVREVAGEVGAQAVYLSRGYDPNQVKQERQLNAWGVGAGVEVRRFGGRLLFEPERIKTLGGEPFRVFTPFWKACLAQPEPSMPRPAPGRLTTHAGVATLELDALELLPCRPDWSGGLAGAWAPGEAGAQRQLEVFLDDVVAGYYKQRDEPGVAGTSRLSPHLHFGEISPRQVWHAIRSRQVHAAESGSDAFVRQLGWREFCHHLLLRFPELAERPFRRQFAAFPWLGRPSQLAAWQQGQTGVPIVDAGMRQLWRTGWMHNRVRMIAASYLIKNLLIDWRQGQAWFWDTLVDADHANNAAGWQWVAGSGADAAPYFRIFNPVRQGERFDPNGTYVRHWLPELANLPDRYLHHPWDAPDDVLKNSGVRLGLSYPTPLVDLARTRTRALEAYKTIKKKGA